MGFTPMADCAREIIAENGFAHNIKVISKRSTQITVGPDGDMKQRANILVTEVFDSDFIGEGALITFRHALEELLEEDSIVVPSSGRVIVQVIESKLVKRWNKLDDIIVDNKNAIKVPESLEQCPGTYSVHDLQLSQIPTDQFKTIVQPQVIFSFDFLGKTKLEFYRHCKLPVMACNSGVAHAVFMWWELTMDTEDDIVLSCAPHWAHPSPEAKGGADAIPWRDHWMQEIYHFPRDVPVNKGENLKIIGCHDQYGFWFNLTKDENIIEDEKKELFRPACTCNLHLICSYTRIGMLNDPIRREKYILALKRKIDAESIVLSIGECSLLGLIAAYLGAKKVYCQEFSFFSQPVVSNFIKTNNLSNKIELLPLEDDKKTFLNFPDKLLNVVHEVNLIVTEPFFSSAFLPWNHLRWKPGMYNDECVMLPTNATIWALPVQFDHLYKIRAPLNKVFDFNMTEFDQLVLKASNISDSPIELQPLWEYGTVALSCPIKLHEFNLNEDKPEKDVLLETCSDIEMLGRFDAIVLWIEYKLDNDIMICNGPVSDSPPVEPGKQVIWDMYTRQAVCFVKQYFPLNVTKGDELSVGSIFQYKSRDILLNITVTRDNGKVYDNVTGTPSSKFQHLKTK
ncbi:protein arginine N-methyltransferase 7-like isoform X2 [Lycorma delicatula]|uniref:protein arginine N-methyltransferase 7-like isoform X2 n=1 Tax=Lycorma delicatula TaxID=130591 RepID=UPI003F5189E2